MISRDYLIRIIEQAVQAIRRMLGHLEHGDYEAARAAAEEAYDVLGVPPELVPRMSSAALAELLGQPEKIRLMSELCWYEGERLSATRDPVNGLDRRRRAVELLIEAHRLEPAPADASKLQEMFRHVPTATLAPRYRDPDPT